MPITPQRHSLQRGAKPDSAYARLKSEFPDYLAHLEGLRREFHTRCEHLGRLRSRNRHGAVRQLLRMRHLYPAFAFDGLKRCIDFESATPSAIADLAAQFDPFRSCGNEPVIIRNANPRGRSARHVCDFLPKRRMHQSAIARILRHLFPPPENQFLFNGGMPRALRAIETAVSDGATHACELDFVGFYGSVTFDDLAEALRPLPTSVCAHVVWDVRMRLPDLFVHASSARSSPTPEPPNGLFLGSATSPIVGERLIALLLEAAQLPEVITYADNLLVLGRSADEVVARIQQLQRVIDDPPFACVSGLRFRQKEIVEVGAIQGYFAHAEAAEQFGERITFASHTSLTSLDASTNQHHITGWRPTDEKVNQMCAGLREFVTLEQIDEAISMISNWRRYYTGWDDGDLYESRFLATLKTRRFALSRSPEHRASAVAALVDAYLLHQSNGRSLLLSDLMSGYSPRAELSLEQAASARIRTILARASEIEVPLRTRAG